MASLIIPSVRSALNRAARELLDSNKSFDRGVLRATPLIDVACVFLFAGTILVTLNPTGGWARVAIVCVFLAHVVSLVLVATIILFNVPRILVPKAMRMDVGALRGRWTR